MIGVLLRIRSIVLEPLIQLRVLTLHVHCSQTSWHQPQAFVFMFQHPNAVGLQCPHRTKNEKPRATVCHNGSLNTQRLWRKCCRSPECKAKT